MKYPIDADKYITATRMEFGENPISEQLLRESFIPLVNDFYSDGLQGKEFCLGDPEEVMAEFAQRKGLASLSQATRSIFTALVEWCTAAFQLGVQDAKSGVGV